MAMLGEDLVSGLYEKIKHQIVHMQLQPNQRITETQLASEYATSRTPVREALSRLERDGWVVKIPHQGYYVRSFTLAEIEEIYEVDVALEQLAVRLAITKGDRDRLDALRKRWQAMPSAWDEVEGLKMLQEEENFHEELAVIGGNSELIRHMCHINDRLRPCRRIDYLKKDWAQSIVADHLAILSLMEQQNVRDAEAVMETHIRSGMELLASLTAVNLSSEAFFTIQSGGNPK